MADEKKINSVGADNGSPVNLSSYTDRLKEASEKIDRTKAEVDAYKNVIEAERIERAKGEEKLRLEEKQRQSEEDKKRKKIAEERLAALSYAENYREKLRRERDITAQEKKRLAAERLRREAFERELRLKDEELVREKEENSTRGAKFDEMLKRIGARIESSSQSIKAENNIEPIVDSTVAETIQDLPHEEVTEVKDDKGEKESESYILNISADDVGRDLLHIDGITLGDIAVLSKERTEREDEEEKASPAFDVGVITAVSAGAVGAVAIAGSVLDKNGDGSTPSQSNPVAEPVSTPEKEAVYSSDPVVDEVLGQDLVENNTDRDAYDKLNRKVQKKLEREEYRRFLAENDGKAKDGAPTYTDDDPYEAINKGVYDVSEPQPELKQVRRESTSDVKAYERDIENRMGYSALKTERVSGDKTPFDITEEYSPSPSSEGKGDKPSKRDGRAKRREEQEREAMELLEADRLQRIEEERRRRANKPSVAQASGKEYPDYDSKTDEQRRDKRAEAMALASFAKEDEEKRKRRKKSALPHKTTIKVEKGENFDKKRAEALVKEQGSNDEKLVKLHFENRIRALKFESDSLDLRFSTQSGKEKKSKERMSFSIRRTKRDMKNAVRLERRDNERYYALVKTDLDKLKLGRRTDRGELESECQELVELLNRRDEINLALAELYTGRTKGRSGRSHEINAETKEYRAKVKEFKRQRKLLRQMNKMSVSADNRKKIYQLMDECVELKGRSGELEYRLKKEKLRGKARREAMKELKRNRKEYRYTTIELKRYSHRAFIRAEKRNKSRHATALGIFLLLLLVGVGVSAYVFRDTLWQLVSSMLPM